MRKEKILIVCHTFPPEKGIGGRRWAKFAKYLCKCNYQVHVITKKNAKRSRFNADSFGLENVSIHEVDAFYPDILSKRPKNIFEKLKYNFWIRILPFFHKGSIYDRSIFMESALRKKMERIIKRFDMKLVFVTCAPFYLARYSIKLKEKLDFFLTIDFRDPWTWGKGYGYSVISTKRKLFDRKVEKEVVEKADLIISPSSAILKHLSSHHALGEEKIYHVPHAVDSDKINEIKSNNIEKTDKSLKCVYAGTLYDGYFYFLNNIIEILNEERSKSSEFYRKFQFDIFSTNESNEYSERIKEAGFSDKIKFYNAIPEADLFKKIINYDYSLIYFPAQYKDFITTKFYELIYLNLQIIYVGSCGVLSQFISENRLGFYIDIKDFRSSFVKDLESFGNQEVVSSFERDKYTYESVTNDMMSRVKHLLINKRNSKEKLF